jgi:hypothetical protein
MKKKATKESEEKPKRNERKSSFKSFFVPKFFS